MPSPLTSPSSATVAREPVPFVTPKIGSELVGSAPMPTLLEKTPKATTAETSARERRGRLGERRLTRRTLGAGPDAPIGYLLLAFDLAFGRGRHGFGLIFTRLPLTRW